MPPIAALLICIVFVVALLAMDARRKPAVSFALWVPFIWLLIVGSRPVSFWFLKRETMISAEDVLSGSPFDRTVLSILIIIGLCILFRRAIDWPKMVKSNFWILVWVLYGGISILWSDYSGVAFKRWIKEIGTIIMVLIVMTEQDPAESIKVLLRRSAYVLIPLSIIAIKYYRDAGVAYSPWGGSANIAGVATDKNALGRLCLVSAFFFFWALASFSKNKRLPRTEFLVDLLFLFMIIWLLYSAHSATSTATLLIGMFSFAALGIPVIKKNLKYLGMFLFLTVFLLFFLQWAFNIIENAVALLGRDITLTGRTDLWKDLLALGANPVFGAGYDSFWLGDRLEKLWDKYWWMPNEAHNGYLEIYLNLGLAGLTVLSGIMVSTYKSIQRTLISDFDYGRFKMAFFVMVLFYNITEAAFRGLTLMWLVFLLIALDYPRRSKVPVFQKAIVKESEIMPAPPHF